MVEVFQDKIVFRPIGQKKKKKNPLSIIEGESTREVMKKECSGLIIGTDGKRLKSILFYG